MFAAHRHSPVEGRTAQTFVGTVEGTGDLVCLDVNTEPGTSEIPLLPELAALAGLPFGELIRCLVEDAAFNR